MQQQDVVEILMEEERKRFSRDDFIKQLKFQWDSFQTPVAEQELTSSDQGASLLFFFRQQDPDDSNQSIVFRLRNPKPSFIFGTPGMGKTALRLASSAYIRAVSNHSLSVTYSISRDFANEHTLSAHLTKLSQQLAIDLFLQVLEQFNPDFDEPDAAQSEGLGILLALGGRSLRRLAQRILKEPEPEGRMGLAELWYIVGRLPVRCVKHSEPLQVLVRQATTATDFPKPPLYGEKALEKSLEIARLWGFEDIYLFVDGVDTWERTVQDMFAGIEALLKQTTNLCVEEHIYCKYFLPDSLFEPVTKFISQNAPLAQQQPDIIQLHWSKSDLRRLLEQRFRAAGSRRSGFNGLSDPAWTADLDEMIIQKADGSPRQLLTTINILIDKHVERITLMPSTNGNGSSNYFSQNDWQRTVDEIDSLKLFATPAL